MKAAFKLPSAGFSSAKIQQKATFCNSLFGLYAKKVPIFLIFILNIKKLQNIRK